MPNNFLKINQSKFKISLKIIDDFDEYEANEDSIDEGKDSGIYR